MNTMSVISIVFDSIVTNIFHSLWIVAWIFYINHSTGIYSNIAELSRDVYVCNKMLDSHINTKGTDTDTDVEDRLKTLEEDIEHMTKKLSKVKKMYIALSENVAKLNDRVIDIEDEIYNEEEVDVEEEEEEESCEESSSSEDTKLLEKKHRHRKNKID